VLLFEQTLLDERLDLFLRRRVLGQDRGGAGLLYVDTHFAQVLQVDFLQLCWRNFKFGQRVESDVQCSEVERLFEFQELENLVAEDHLLVDVPVDGEHVHGVRHLRALGLGLLGVGNKRELPHKGVVV